MRSRAVGLPRVGLGCQANRPQYNALLKRGETHAIEEVGSRLRGMMPLAQKGPTGRQGEKTDLWLSRAWMASRQRGTAVLCAAGAAGLAGAAALGWTVLALF